VIGAGAAGLMCALTAGRRGRMVQVIDHANKVGKKILMSGGGRCNFTNTGTAPANFLSANPHFCKSALARYTPWDFIDMVERHGIAYHEKELGQLFCDISSKQIVRMLVDECTAAGAQQSNERCVDGFIGRLEQAECARMRQGLIGHAFKPGDQRREQPRAQPSRRLALCGAPALKLQAVGKLETLEEIALECLCSLAQRVGADGIEAVAGNVAQRQQVDVDMG